MIKEDSEKLARLPAEIKNLKRFVLPDSKEWSCFNPSIAQAPKKGYAMAFRSSNYVILQTGELHVTNGGKIKNQVWFTETDKNLTFKKLRRIEVPQEILPTPRGVEDPKLFWREGYWHFTATMMETHTPVARLCVCKMDSKATKVTEITTFDGLDTKRPEKNWMTPDLNASEHFDFIYGPNAAVKGQKIVFTMTDNPKFTGLRGSSHLVEQSDGTYLAVMHKLWTKKTSTFVPTRFGVVEGFDKNYGHYLVRFDRFGSIIEISEAFQFFGRGIEFAAGLVEMDGNLVISFGRDDVSSHAAIIDKRVALSMMKVVK